MLTFNIDPDTWIYEDWIKSEGMKPEEYYSIQDLETGKKYFFRKTPMGIMPQMIKDFLVSRDEKRKLMKEAKEKGDMKAYDLYYAESFALKSFINAVYGVLAYRFRKSSEYCAACVTLIGRELTKLAIKTAKDLGYNVIYGDTDSIFVEAKSNSYKDSLAEGLRLKDRIEKEIPNLLAKYGYNGQSNFIMEIDKIYSSFFTLDVKKRYAGYVEDEKQGKKLYTAGPEVKRSDSSRFSKSLQEQLIRMTLDGSKKEDILDYVTNKLNEYDMLDILEIAVPSALTKDVDKYLRTDKKTGKKVPFNPTQKKAAMNSNEFLGTKYREGDKPKRVYVKEILEKKPDKVVKNIDVVAITKNDQLPNWLQIDYPKMISKTVKKKIQKILMLHGINWEDIKLKETLKEVKRKRTKSEKKVQTSMDLFVGGKEDVRPISSSSREGK